MDDLTGKRFGRLEVLERDLHAKREVKWMCRCDCGGRKTIPALVLKRGDSKSCGCLQREAVVERSSTHGLTKHPLYRSWGRIKDRCYYEGNIAFDRYGGRGITVCDEWVNSFEAFYADNINRWAPGLTFDRINNDLGYSLENTRWTTMKEQNRNRSNTVMMTHNGETLPLVVWAERTGIPASALRQRQHGGWSDELSLTHPHGKRRHRATSSPA